MVDSRGMARGPGRVGNTGAAKAEPGGVAVRSGPAPGDAGGTADQATSRVGRTGAGGPRAFGPPDAVEEDSEHVDGGGEMGAAQQVPFAEGGREPAARKSAAARPLPKLGFAGAQPVALVDSARDSAEGAAEGGGVRRATVEAKKESCQREQL